MKDFDFSELINKIRTNIYNKNKLEITLDPFYDDEPLLDDERVSCLAEALKYNKYITEIDLSGNNLTDISAMALSNIESLETIGLGYNKITINGAIALAKSAIKKLDLQFNPLVIDNTFVMACIQNKTITELNLSFCSISSKNAADLIRYNTTINKLSLGENLTDNALKFIGINNTLEELSIAANKITDKGIKYLVENNSIKRFILDESNVTDIGAKMLSQHPSLKELSLLDSNITKKGSRYFFDGNLNKVVIFNGGKHNFMSPSEIANFRCEFENYQLQKLKEQQEYYYQLVRDQQYLDINPDMNNFDSIQYAIDFLQRMWANEEFLNKENDYQLVDQMILEQGSSLEHQNFEL